MIKGFIKSLSVTVIIAVWLSAGAFLRAEEEFQGKLLTGSGVAAEKMIKLKITIERYTSADEVLKLIDVFSQQGYESFVDKFRTMIKGFFLPVGGHGVKVNIHAAHSIQKEKGRQILLFCERQTWDLGSMQRVDNRFPYMVIELNLDDKGKGEGKFYEQANIKLTPQGTIELESYNSPPKRIFAVSTMK